MIKKGGYIIIDLQSASIVNDLAKALDSNKPVLVYDANNDANFYTLSYDSDNSIYTLTGATGGYTINASGEVTPVASGNNLYRHAILIETTNASLSNYSFVVCIIYNNSSTQITNFSSLLVDGKVECNGAIMDDDAMPIPAIIQSGESGLEVTIPIVSEGALSVLDVILTASDSSINTDNVYKMI